MQIKIDESRCIGCGMCAAAVPEVFAIVGRVSTAVGAPEKSRESRVFDAANGCPVNAISAKRCGDRREIPPVFCWGRLQNPEKGCTINGTEQRGVRIAGLRGDRHGLYPRPDLDHANVGR